MFPENDRAIKDVLKESSCSSSFSYRYSSRLSENAHTLHFLAFLGLFSECCLTKYGDKYGDKNKILLQPWGGERTQQTMQEAECPFITSVARKENYQVQRLSQADWHTAAQLQKHADISPMPRILASTAQPPVSSPYDAYDSSDAGKFFKVFCGGTMFVNLYTYL